MTISITGIRPHLSVGEFDPVELSSFSLIIGPNGAGKSHLLEAIRTGAVHCSALGPIPDLIPGGSSHMVRLLHNGDPLPQGITSVVEQTPDAIFSQDTLEGDPQVEFARYRAQLVAEFLPKIEEALGGKLEEIAPSEAWPLCTPLERLLQLASERGLEPNKAAVEELYNHTCNLLEHHTETLLGHPNYISENTGQPILCVRPDEALSNGTWGRHEAFQVNFVQIFSTYLRKRFANRFKQLSDANERATALSDEEFEQRWGSPPWEKVSDALASFGFPYRVKPPSDNPRAQLRLQFEDSHGRTIDVESLSSGEKVLLQFALAIFQADSSRINLSIPKLLLLDEVDASLHPKNVHRLLNAIQSGFVGMMGVPVIMTTHSPTTVALAPDDGIFEMTEDDRVPRPITKQQALNRLTIDLPTLSIDYSGRRQVFVESSVDADQYERLSRHLKTELDLPRSLNFVAAAGKAKGDTLGGCSVVTGVVDALVANGVGSLYGLIDWDAKNDPRSRIKVLGHGTHYSKENLLLDPLLVAILLLQDKPRGLSFPITLPELAGAADEKLQALADVVCHKLGLPGETVNSRYLNGLVLTVPQAYQRMNGHQLEQLLMKEFPCLNRYGGSGKWLPDPIIDRVLSDFPGFCPMPIATVFREIAEEMPE